MGDAVDNDAVAGRLGHFDAADVDVFGLDAIDAHGVDPVDQRARKRVFHSVNDADLVQSQRLPTFA